MRTYVNASFNDKDNAELCLSRIKSLYPDARISCSNYISNEPYNGGAALSFNVNNGQGYYFPRFYGDNINGKQRSEVTVKCTPNQLGRITSILIDGGGRIR